MLFQVTIVDCQPDIGEEFREFAREAIKDIRRRALREAKTHLIPP